MSQNSKVYQVKANDFVFSFTEEMIAAADIILKPDGSYHLLRDHQSDTVKVVSSNVQGKEFSVETMGESFAVEIKDELDQMLEQMGFGITAVKQVKEIKAPMPGLVLEISVQEMQEVKEGERLLILEAMKMENSIMIHTDATIKKIHVKPGQAVEKGQLLLELD